MAIKEVLHTDLAPAAVGPYSQAIASNGFIYTSGQIPIDPATGKIEAATIEEQTEQVMKNLQYVLAQGGVSFDSNDRRFKIMGNAGYKICLQRFGGP